MLVRPGGRLYLLVIFGLSAGLAAIGAYLTVSGYPWVGVPAIAVSGLGVSHAAILTRWLRTPARVTFAPDGLRIASPAVLRSDVFVEWADIELVWLRFGVSSLPEGTVVLGPLAVPVEVLLRLSGDVSPDARRWLGLLVEPMGSSYGHAAEMPRPGQLYRRLAFRTPSRDALARLEAELRRHGIPIGG